MNALTSNRTRIRRHNGTLFACNRRTGLAETTVARLLLVACSTTASATQHLLVSATHTCPSHTNTCICMHFQSICIPTRICYAFSHWRTADRQLFSFVLFFIALWPYASLWLCGQFTCGAFVAACFSCSRWPFYLLSRTLAFCCCCLYSDPGS